MERPEPCSDAELAKMMCQMLVGDRSPVFTRQFSEERMFGPRLLIIFFAEAFDQHDELFNVCVPGSRLRGESLERTFCSSRPRHDVDHQVIERRHAHPARSSTRA